MLQGNFLVGQFLYKLRGFHWIESATSLNQESESVKWIDICA